MIAPGGRFFKQEQDSCPDWFACPRGSAPYEAQHGFAASRTVSRNASDAMPSRVPPAHVLQSRQYRHRECDAGMYAVTCHGYVRASLLAACCQ